MFGQSDYDRDTDDVFKIQEELAKLIVASVRKKLAVVSPVFLEGLGAIEAVHAGLVEVARDCFERAIREDRDNPSIYVAMADYYAAAAIFAVREPKQLLPKAEWAAKRALELDPPEKGAHASLAVVEAIYYCRWDLAATHFLACSRTSRTFSPICSFWRPVFTMSPKSADPRPWYTVPSHGILPAILSAPTGWLNRRRKPSLRFGRLRWCRP